MKALAAIGRGVARALAALGTPEGRRGWALLFLSGGGMAFTGMAAVALWLAAGHADHVLWLGIAAHVQVFAVFTGIAALLVKRRIKWSGFGTDLDIDDTRAAAAVAAASEALDAKDG